MLIAANHQLSGAASQAAPPPTATRSTDPTTHSSEELRMILVSTSMSINLLGRRNLTEAVIQEFCRKFPEAREVRLSSSNVQGPWLRHLLALPHLTYLYLYSTQVGDADIECLTVIAARLKTINVQGTRLSPASIGRLRQMCERVWS